VRICYLVPGHRLVPSAGPTRNVLSVASRLAAAAEVTVAFSDGLEGAPPGVSVREIAPGRSSSGGRRPPTDDAALRGIGYADFIGFIRALRRFVAATAGDFDVVLEKGWLLSGYASARYRAAGVPSIPVENLVPLASSAGRADPGTAVRRSAGRRIARRHLVSAPKIIAETTALRGAITECYGVAPARIEVVELGVDRDRFRPGDRESARRALGLAEDAAILLYIGVLDRIHDLEPVLAGLAGAPGWRLEIVGDGPLAVRYADRASELGLGDRVRFRGRVPHDDVARHVAAADVCLAPYDPGAFFGGEVAYSTLKIREYLAAGRPVLSVRSGSIPDLVEHGRTGLLVSHDDAGWAEALAGLPGRDELHAMGERAAASPPREWDDVARDYLRICQSMLGGEGV